jgi:hypothetical protein
MGAALSDEWHPAVHARKPPTKNAEMIADICFLIPILLSSMKNTILFLENILDTKDTQTSRRCPLGTMGKGLFRLASYDREV